MKSNCLFLINTHNVSFTNATTSARDLICYRRDRTSMKAIHWTHTNTHNAQIDTNNSKQFENHIRMKPTHTNQLWMGLGNTTKQGYGIIRISIAYIVYSHCWLSNAYNIRGFGTIFQLYFLTLFVWFSLFLWNSLLLVCGNINCAKIQFRIYSKIDKTV